MTDAVESSLVVSPLPECLTGAAERAVHDWLQRVAEAGGDQPDAVWLAAIQRAFGLSDFLREQALRYPELLPAWIANGGLRMTQDPAQVRQALMVRLQGAADEPAMHKVLRVFRREAMFRIIWRDLLKWADYHETVRDMSALADMCIDGALDWVYADACRQWGTPLGARDGQPQRMVVLGMGKLGAGELNVSSDIDLIFAFPHHGETTGGHRALDNQQFFTRVGQRLNQALDKITADGFVFRVDMRLRPYGQSGALALSFSAMEEYYQDQGREWERYAMIKARVVAGDQQQGARLMQSLRPFVYRRYIDFSVFESLRDMKGMINREVRRKGLEDNIKLGAGGIREVEFIVQAFQLIRGGREPELQRRELLHVLGELEKLELLPERVVAELRAAYLFLRDTEHAIQGLADQQTQLLPKDPIGQARVASIMGFPEWAPFSAVLDGHRARVSGHFADIVAGDDAQESAQEHLAEWQAIWQGDAEDTALGWLGAQGYEAPAQALEQIARLRESRAVQIMQAQGRQRLDQFMPILLSAVAAAECPSRTLERVLGLVEAVLRRTAYLVLLIENPGALAQLVNLCSASPWIAEQLAETPMLLDELLNAHSLYKPPLKSELQSDLRQQLLRIPEDDLEEQMECLRHFKRAHVLRVAASELRGTLPLMKVSDYLTWIAEAVLDQVVELAWNALVRKHGRPTRADGSPCDKDFAVIGYGKLGGIELGYTSDLDVVFIHGADVSLSTDGERAIDNGVFFARLGQRIVHILSTQMASGQLYEVDMRLRPSGNSGLLVSSLAAFERYQRQEAWTWEHQALVRARWVAGSAQPGEDFELLRRALMALPRERSKLRRDVVEMREKMRESLGTKPGADGIYAQFHIKHDAGGIVDIEFLVQYLLLAHTQTWPELARWSDNIRQLEALGEQGVLETPVVERLREIYIAMRSTIHRRALQKLSSRVEADAFPEERAFVKAQWQQIMLAEET